MTTEGKGKGRKFLVIALVIIVVLGVSVALLVKYANQIIKVELERRLGKAFTIEKNRPRLGPCRGSGREVEEPCRERGHQS